MAYEDLSDYSEDFEDEVASTHEPESIHGHSHASISLVDENYYSSGYYSTVRGGTRGGGTAQKPPPAVCATKHVLSSNSTRKERGIFRVPTSQSNT